MDTHLSRELNVMLCSRSSVTINSRCKDAQLFPKGIRAVEVGVWAAPVRNKVSFEFNNPNIPADLLYKVAYCEPQIWIYARPF